MPPLSEREKVGRALKWPRDVILKWLLQSDSELEAVKKRLAKVRVVKNATPGPMLGELVVNEPVPPYQLYEAERLINEIEKEGKGL